MKVPFLLSVLLFNCWVSGQQKQGVVIYERKQNMHRNVGEEMQALIPEFRVTKQMLIFNNSQSIYKALPEDEAPDPFNNKGGMSIRLGGQNSETHMDFNENRKTTANDVFGEAFLITDTIKKYTWTLVDETKKVAGLLCKKATTITKTFRQGMRIIDTKKVADASNVPSTKPEETEIVAWYAIDLVSSSGPESYTGLPGVILELDVDNGGTNFVAKEIRPLTDINQLKPPKKGRKVTPEEYNKEIKKIVENMGSGPIQIKSGM